MKKKISKQIVLSFIASSLLCSQANALPQGGKFTHGSTGSITSNANTMNITGNNQNNVIQWGGGFNIAHGESVNFTTSNKNYLNIAYQKDASKIDGKLNGGTNNIFLVNPMGVLIGANGSIIANKFVASTTAIKDSDVKNFLTQGASFSPIFNPNKRGNIVNLGTINADDIILVGNKVEIGNSGVINGKDETSNAKKAHLVGNYVYVSVGEKNGKNTVNVDSLKGTAIKEGYLQRDMTSFANDGYIFGDFKNIEKTSYNNTQSIDFTKAVTIGSQSNNKANAYEWKLFADGWNRQGIKGDIFKDGLTTIRLVNNIDFSNYQAIDPVGAVIAFSGKFDGGGHTLKNLTIKAQGGDWNTGIFGNIKGTSNNKAQIYNLTVDGLKFSGKTNFGGGFVAQSENADFYNIHLKRFGGLNFYDPNKEKSNFLYAGGFVGYAKNDSKFDRISLDNFDYIAMQPEGKFSSAYVDIYLGGFAGLSESSIFNNISLKNIGSIAVKGSETGGNIFTGGFVGYAKDGSNFSKIDLNHIGKKYGIIAQGNTFVKHVGTGGFVGAIEGINTFDKISLIDFGDIRAERGYVWTATGYYNVGAGGFAGILNPLNKGNLAVDFKNILVNFNNNMKIYAKAGSGTYGYWEHNAAGGFLGGLFTKGLTRKVNFDNVYVKLGKNVAIDAHYKANEASGKEEQGMLFGVFSESWWDNQILKTKDLYIYYANNDKLNWWYDDLKSNFFQDKYGRSYGTIFNSRAEEIANITVTNGLKRKGDIVVSDSNKGYVSYFNNTLKLKPEIPNFKNPTAWSKNDFDPKMLQRILDDIFNGKYVYKLGEEWYIDLGNNHLVKWSEFVDNKEGKYNNNPIYQSINFLNHFDNKDIAKNFKDTWNHDSSQNYKNYVNLHSIYKSKFNTDTIENKYQDYQEALNKYQAVVDAMNQFLDNNTYANRLQELVDNIKNYNEASEMLNKAIDNFYKIANKLQIKIDDYNNNFTQFDDKTAYNQFINLQEQIKNFTDYKNELEAQKNALFAQFNQINAEKNTLEQIYNDLFNQQADINVNKNELDKLKQDLADLKLDSLVDDPNHSLNSIGIKDADGKEFVGSYIFSGALKNPDNIPFLDKPTDDKYVQNNINLPSISGLNYEPSKPEINDKPTLPDQKPENNDNPNQGGDNTVDIDNDNSNALYADIQDQDEKEDEENRLSLDEAQIQEKGVLCVVSDDFRTMNICAIK
ncbi:filamentous hemagglutinin N-terminal domain-containing protein [Campylobacter coli]|nr:filamentous hemagglutinin N-terminal domain-containing protein [Campylobacter coli]EFL6826690.1 filamentous hemagglutinin N-terminal domain-containing protein [Campylobacter coli]EFV1822062.1 filamentous hemagglutinin N-terminal domain-containing protein [Campylobacter coli]EGH6346366.1 filamentous hemagglutinin N-terminal domain-containing protein [Campylobacter coli]EGS0653618.1 filamentous hemagglutinin N-terminal domain-containing protein [Campylobacter coli]